MHASNPPVRGDVADPYAAYVPPEAVSAESAAADPVPDDLPDDADDDEFEPL